MNLARVHVLILAALVLNVGCGARTSTLEEISVDDLPDGSSSADATSIDVKPVDAGHEQQGIDDGRTGHGANGCFRQLSPGGACVYQSLQPGEPCAVGALWSEGSCPSSGLYGCCVTSGSGPIVADCYYNATEAEGGLSRCDRQRPPGVWQTNAP
jgi:hypothetical protein